MTTPTDATPSVQNDPEDPENGHGFRVTASSLTAAPFAEAVAAGIKSPVLSIKVWAWTVGQALRRSAELPLSTWVAGGTTKPAGQVAYEAYCVSSGGKSAVSGAPLPSWGGQSQAVRDHWEAAGRAVAGTCGR